MPTRPLENPRAHSSFSLAMTELSKMSASDYLDEAQRLRWPLALLIST